MSSTQQPLLSDAVCSRCLSFFGHICRADSSQDHSRALYASTTGLPKHWRRRPGRPRQTWLQTIESDLRPLNLVWRQLNGVHRQNSLADTRGNGYVTDKLRMMKMSPFWILLELRMMEVVVTAGPIRHTKTQSDRHHSKPTPSVFTDWMPFCCPPRSIRALKGKAYLLFCGHSGLNTHCPQKVSPLIF